jgi:hypothetical protein
VARTAERLHRKLNQLLPAFSIAPQPRYNFLLQFVTKKKKKKKTPWPLVRKRSVSTQPPPRNSVPTFVDRGMSRGQRGGSPTSLISVFWTGAATFLSSSSSFILRRAEWTPFQTHCYSENLLASGIEPGTSVFAARNFDHYTRQAVAICNASV